MSCAKLLPDSTSDFTSPQYWKQFFAQRKSPFEWYGDYSQFGEVLEKYLKANDAILQIGCGNSLLASQLYDSGFRNVTSVDLEDRVIQDQKRRNASRAGLVFEVDDACSLSAADNSYSVVIDKGTLDALLPPSPTVNQEKAVKSMFDGVLRIMKPGGRYIIISLAQSHLLRFWYQYFSQSLNVILKIHQLPTKSNGGEAVMPVFFLIVSKMLKPMAVNMPLQMLHADKRLEKLENVEQVLEVLQSVQELSRLIHLCSGKLGNEVQFTVAGVDGNLRYKLIILDADTSVIKSYSVFIVPLGREFDWLFSTPKGRKSILSQCKVDRMMLAVLYRNQKYGSMMEVKEELTSFAERIDPRGSGRIEFCTMGDVDMREIISSGYSEVNGDYSVEDVVISDDEYRRLIFTSSQGLIQSEALIKKVKGKKRLDLDRLTCEHHKGMVSAMAFMDPSPILDKKLPLKVAVLGLGGGLFATFLYRNFPNAVVTGVELDPIVANIAKNHFSLPTDAKRLKIRVEDALDYLKNTANSEEKLDVLFVDLAGSLHEDGLCGPPSCFIENDVLNNMKSSLKVNGILALNVITRDPEIAERVRKNVRNVFPFLYHIIHDEDINEVLIGFSSEPAKQPQLPPLTDNWTEILDGIKRMSKI